MRDFFHSSWLVFLLVVLGGCIAVIGLATAGVDFSSEARATHIDRPLDHQWQPLASLLLTDTMPLPTQIGLGELDEYGAWGATWVYEDQTVIVIDPDCPDMMRVIVNEAAHAAMATAQVEAHGAHWGVSYAEMYRRAVGE